MNHPLRQPQPDDPPAPSAGIDATPLPSAPTMPPAGGPAVAQDAELSGMFDRYRIDRRIGRGGMGTVYAAEDTELLRPVAIKVPRLDLPDQEQIRERFYREARAAARLRHPNICPIFDVGVVGGLPYFTMALIDGVPLHRWSAAKRTTTEILRVVRKIALAIHEAHTRDVIHRDLKPANVLIDASGEPIVMDFGLARRTAPTAGEQLTALGVILGTPAYMAPEQVTDQDRVGPPSDVYALGVILYELLAGRLPFVGDSMAVIGQLMRDEVRPPSTFLAGIDPRAEAVCMAALAKNPASRHGTMNRFAEALEAVLAAGRLPAAQAVKRSEEPPASTDIDPAELRRVLDTLRRYGLARAVQKLRTRASRQDNVAQRRASQGFLDWMTGTPSPDGRAVEEMQSVTEGRSLRGWVLAGQASHALRERDYHAALRHLENCERQADPDDRMLRATIAHTRASALVHLGQCEAALPLLHQALDLFERGHFMTGRVLDTLGMAYATKGNFPIAREFYQQSIRYKEQAGDEAGVAISHGQLGRLYLDWGHLDDAERHFQLDLAIAQSIRSVWSEAQIFNHLGQVEIARAERELALSRRQAARRCLTDAAAWLDQSISLTRDGKYPVSEGFARKDRAMVHVLEGSYDAADEQLKQATQIFAAARFEEGQAKAQMVEGMLLRHRRKWPEAERRFRSALSHFEATRETDDAVRAAWEIARTVRDAGSAGPLVTRAYLDALRRAEAARHDPMVADIERELHDVDADAYMRHVYRRMRGAGIDDDSPSLMSANSEVGSVISADLPGFSEFSQGMDAETVLLTFNHLLADLADVLARQGARVLAYRGSGLLAVVREARHAERAVRAALDLVGALDEFNRPRRLLQLPVFGLRIGVSSGDLLLGNVGTYHKLDFTVLGQALNLAGALRSFAETGSPLIARTTYDQVRERFAYKADSPRTIEVTGFGRIEVWDVMR